MGKKVRLEWSLADVLKAKKIPVDQFFNDVRKIKPDYSDFSLKRLLYGNVRRINVDLLGVLVSLLDCKIEDLVCRGEKKPGEIFFEGDMASLVSRESAEEFFPVEITEEEALAFDFLKDQRVGSAKDHVGTSVSVAEVIKLLQKKRTQRSTYITLFFKVLRNENLPVREDKASGRFMCFLRNTTADQGYVSLVIMSTKAVTLKRKHSLTTLDILKNYTTFREKQQIVSPWFEVEALKSIYGFVDYPTQDFKRYVLMRVITDLKNNLGMTIDFELNKVLREIKHIRFLVN